MKKFLLLSSVLFAFVVSGPVFADEVGPAKPTSSSTQTTTSDSTECSTIETWLGLCTVESEETTEF